LNYARLQQAGLTPRGIVDDLRRIALLVSPPAVPRVVPNDPDDDHVLACALAASAELIVSGDRHLLALGSFQGMPIVKLAEAVKIVGVKKASLTP
jgi:uncharacterized protein